jgi:hypothetical protein
MLVQKDNSTSTLFKSQVPVGMEVVYLVILLLISFYVVYFAPQYVSRIFFVLLFLMFLLSKRDYLWFAYIFIIAHGPGYIFSDFSASSAYRLPLFTILAGFSLTPIDIFVILVFIKALVFGHKTRILLARPLLILLVYFAFSFSIVSFIYGTTIDVLAWNLRWLFYYSSILSFTFLVSKKEEVYRFILLLFPFVFFILFTQVFYAGTGKEFIDLFDPGFRGVSLNSLTGEIRPLAGGFLLVFLSYICALAMLEERTFRISRIYLSLVIAISFCSVFVSATRMWFVIFTFIFVGYVLVTRKKIMSVVGAVIFVLLFVMALTYLMPQSQLILLHSSFGRLSQVADIAHGDVYSVDTAMNRLIYQFPRIMAVVKQNPFLGYGISNVTMDYYDCDFGFINTILMFGIIGFALFIFLFAKIFSLLTSSLKDIGSGNPFRMSLKVLIIAWAGILIGYFTTWDFFAFYFEKILFVAVMIALTEFFVKQAHRVEVSKGGS